MKNAEVAIAKAIAKNLLFTNIDKLPWMKGMRARLYGNDLYYLGDILALSEEEFIMLPNLSRKTLAKEYWKECVEKSLRRAGIAATEEQIRILPSDMRIAYECAAALFSTKKANPHLCPICSGRGRAGTAYFLEVCRAMCQFCGGK